MPRLKILRMECARCGNRIEYLSPYVTCNECGTFQCTPSLPFLKHRAILRPAALPDGLIPADGRSMPGAAAR